MENLEWNIVALSVRLTLEDMAELKAIASADSVKGINMMMVFQP